VSEVGEEAFSLGGWRRKNELLGGDSAEPFMVPSLPPKKGGRAGYPATTIVKAPALGHLLGFTV